MPASVPGPVRSKAWVLRHLQPLPAVAARLMRLVSTEDIPFREMSELISTDAAISAEVLRLANSPLLGSRCEITGILHALSMMGLERIRALVITVALKNLLSSSLHIPALRRCWRHNLACAVVSKELASACFLNRDSCYTAGLLHDVGRLALLAHYPSEYAEMLETPGLRGGDLLERERSLFETDHCEAGRWLVEDWMFPSEFREITSRHHEEPDGSNFGRLTLVQVGCRIADVLGFQVAGPPPEAGIQELAASLPAFARQRVRLEQELALTVACRINAIECSLG